MLFSPRQFLLVLLTVIFLLGLGAPWAAAQGEARTITDVLGREVTLESPPQRVVGMSASITEILYAIGVTPVGATEGIDYPPEAASLPTFGTGYQPDLEALAALEPDLIIASAQLQQDIVDQLEAIAPTIYVLILTVADVPPTVRMIGQAAWHDTTAEYLAESEESFLNYLEMTKPSEGPSVLIIVGLLQLPNYGKSTSYLGHMASLLGATNIADGEEDSGPFPGYAQLSVESILEADPDIILTITKGPPGVAPMPEVMAVDPVWSSLSAMQNGRVYEVDSRLFLESPGPRFGEAIQELYGILYGQGEAGE